MRSDVAMSASSRGHFRLVHVDADADHGVMDAVRLGMHFGKDAGKFSAADEQIVRPANVEETDVQVLRRRHRGRRGPRRASAAAHAQAESAAAAAPCNEFPRIFRKAICAQRVRGRRFVLRREPQRRAARLASPSCIATVLVESILKKW